MSDPLSVIASIAGLVSVSAKVASIAKQLYDSAKDAPDSISRIREEMEHMEMIFSEVKSFFVGNGNFRPSAARLGMISLRNLMTILSGCVLVCSRLDKKLSEVAGITDSARTPKSTRLIFERVKWGLWTEAEAREIIEDLQRYKSSLHMMLTIIQCKSAREAAENQAKLYELVNKISESDLDSAVQLRELIKKYQNQSFEVDHYHSDNQSANSPESPSTPSIPGSIPESATVDDGLGDRVSIKSFTATASIHSIKPSFREELKASRVYKRLRRIRGVNMDLDSSSQSVFSKGTGDTKGDTWSMLSELSLGDLAISEISVLELPICISDLYDPTPYKHTSNQSLKRSRKGLLRVTWAAHGRLQNAILANNKFTLETLLNLGADIEEPWEDSTPLVFAARKKRWTLCELLLDWEADVNVTDPLRRTPLSYASEYGKVELCRLLLEKGSNVDTADLTGQTPLSYSAKRLTIRTKDVCKLLLDWNAQVDGCVTIHPHGDTTGRSPLSVAAEHLNSSVCKILIDHGALVNMIDSSGQTPLIHAIRNAHYNDAHVHVCQVLLDRGASVSLHDSAASPPLAHAISSGNLNICRLLIERGAAVNSTYAHTTTLTPLMDVVMRAQHIPAAPEICRVLLNGGAYIDAADINGRTPLSIAVEGSSHRICEKLCEVLLQNGANVNLMDSGGRTPLSYAATHCYGTPHIVLHRVATDDYSSRREQIISSHGVPRLLLVRGATVDHQDYTGRTPLSYAAEHRNWDICKLLLFEGANADLPDQKGLTPRLYAAVCGDTSILELFEQHAKGKTSLSIR